MESALTNATSQTNFTTFDWLIVVVYLLVSVGIAFLVKRYAGNMTNFVSAGRAVGTWLGVATLTGTEMGLITVMYSCLLYTSPSPRDRSLSRMPSSA